MGALEAISLCLETEVVTSRMGTEAANGFLARRDVSSLVCLNMVKSMTVTRGRYSEVETSE
jgi:hypothetical protein